MYLYRAVTVQEKSVRRTMTANAHPREEQLAVRDWKESQGQRICNQNGYTSSKRCSISSEIFTLVAGTLSSDEKEKESSVCYRTWEYRDKNNEYKNQPMLTPIHFIKHV